MAAGPVAAAPAGTAAPASEQTTVGVWPRTGRGAVAARRWSHHRRRRRGAGAGAAPPTRRLVATAAIMVSNSPCSIKLTEITQL